MSGFVKDTSVVKQIWGKADTVLFIFAGSAAEFALNKAVDWLYFTGKLPADPLGRLFSTVTYARQIIFSERMDALRAIDKINAIHSGVEVSRGAKIPDWAYRDVLFMLIDYSIRAFELLERKLEDDEKEEVFEVFMEVGQRMHLQGLPANYQVWVTMREEHLQNHLLCSNFTFDLFKQYRKHLGWLRNLILKQVQLMLAPDKVRELMPVKQPLFMKPVLWLYKQLRAFWLGRFFKTVLLPATYKSQIQSLDLV